MKRLWIVVALVMALTACAGFAENVHTTGAWGYHPDCSACGAQMATWGQCTGCFGWCTCYEGYCSASMVPADQCTKHDGNCPLLVIAGAAEEEVAAAPAEPAAAEYADKQAIFDAMRVYMLDELRFVTGCNVVEKDGLEYYCLTFEEGVISHGSDGDGKDWFYNGGILSDFDKDLDGDGVDEFVTITWSEAYDEYDKPNVYITVYEPVDGGYNRAVRVPVPGSRYSEIEVWLTSDGDGWKLMGSAINRMDGGTCFARTMIYKYDGKNMNVIHAMGVDNYYGGVIVAENNLPDVTCDYITNNYVNPTDTSMYEGFSTQYIGYRGAGYDPVPDGFARMSDELWIYGIETAYDTYDVDFTGMTRLFHFCGRHDDNASGADLAYGVLSSQSHTGGSSASASGSLDFFGTGTVIDEQPVEEQDPVEDDSEYFIADSNERLLTRDELSQYTTEELGFIRNEILARYGYPFKKEKYRDHFESTSWYVRNEGFVYSMLNEIEMKNVELIKSME